MLVIAEPFLIVGLIATIRRMLVITLEAATLSKEGAWVSDGANGIFHSSTIELGVLGLLVIILVYSITLLRRGSASPGPPGDVHPPAFSPGLVTIQPLQRQSLSVAQPLGRAIAC